MRNPSSNNCCRSPSIRWWSAAQRQSSQQPIPVTSPLMIRLKGKSLNKGATISQVLVNFDGESKSLKKPIYDDKSKTLTLFYPLAQYRVVIDLLRNDTVYCQFLSYANGHIWADLHTGGCSSALSPAPAQG